MTVICPLRPRGKKPPVATAVAKGGTWVVGRAGDAGVAPGAEAYRMESTWEVVLFITKPGAGGVLLEAVAEPVVWKKPWYWVGVQVV